MEQQELNLTLADIENEIAVITGKYCACGAEINTNDECSYREESNGEFICKDCI